MQRDYNEGRTTGWHARLIGVLLMAVAVILGGNGARAQGFLKWQRGTLPLFQGLAVSGDLAGLLQMQLSDYGQYEAALRVNLHNHYFPTFELGYGKADHSNDEVTGITYRTKAPYFRVGCDVNLLKNKRSHNRVFGGLRYAYTNYKIDMFRQPFPDPVWQWDTSFGVHDEQCYQHWLELLFGIDAKVMGPVHLGWTVRYRRRLAHDDGIIGKAWYVPGFGTQGSTKLGYTFVFTIDI